MQECQESLQLGVSKCHLYSLTRSATGCTELSQTVFQRLKPSRMPLPSFTSTTPPPTPRHPPSPALHFPGRQLAFNTIPLHSRHLTGMEIRCKWAFSRRVSTCLRPCSCTGEYLRSSLEAAEGGCCWLNRRESGHAQ